MNLVHSSLSPNHYAASVASVGGISYQTFNARRRTDSSKLTRLKTHPCSSTELRIGSPMFNRCWHGTLINLAALGSHQSNCYYHQDLHYRRLQLGSRQNNLQRHRHATLLVKASRLVSKRCCINGHASEESLSAIHFQGYSLRQVSCYTLLSGCQLPWPPSCCLQRITPFQWFREIAFV